MKLFLIIFFCSSLLLAVKPGIEINSGVTGPLDSNDNRHYNPSVFIESTLFLDFDRRTSLGASYGHLFANGGEYTQDQWPWGDVFTNYRTDAFFLKGLYRRSFSNFNLEGGVVYWSYETTRDVVYWGAD